MKFCPTCNKEKSLSEFNKNQNRKDGYQRECRECNHSSHDKYYYSKKSPRLKENLKHGHKKCTKCNLELELISFKPCKDGRFNVSSECRSCTNKRWNEYQKRTGQNKRLNKFRRETNPQYKLKQILRSRLLDALKRHTSGGKVNKFHSALILLGCSIEEFKQYLELKFTPEMAWENHGKIWEIDHIKCCDSFDLTKLEEQQKCFHYLNQQPLTVSQNRSKSNK